MERAKSYFLLHIGLFVFSLSSVFSKFAGRYPFLSHNFILNYGFMLSSVGIYALLWQQVLKQLPLMLAFSNKAVVVIWGLIWGLMLFGETLSLAKVVGSILVITGVFIMVNSDE